MRGKARQDWVSFVMGSAIGALCTVAASTTQAGKGIKVMITVGV